MRETCFQDYGDEAVASGYKPVWFDGYDVGGKSYVNVVFRPGGGDWVLRNGLTSAAYQSQVTDWDAKGYRLTHVESYRSGDAIRYAFIAEKRRARADADRRLPRAHRGAAPAAREPAEGAGLRAPGRLGRLAEGQALLHRALAVARAGGWLLASTIEHDDYQHWVEVNHAAKRELAYVNAYNHDGKVWFSAVVTPQASIRAARHDLGADALGIDLARLHGQGAPHARDHGLPDGRHASLRGALALNQTG